MKKKILFIIGIVICLGLCACSAGDAVGESSESLDSSLQTDEPFNEPEESEPSAEVSLPSSAGVSEESDVDMIKDAEMVLMDVYKPMILHFPERIDSQNPISEEEAYYCFQCYAICQLTARNEEYDHWVIKGDNEYDLYYSKDIVETFMESYFGISAERMQEIEEYIPEKKGYKISVYSGKDQSVLNITDSVLEGNACSFSFTYSVNDYMEAGQCKISLRKDKDSVTLESFEGDIPGFE